MMTSITAFFESAQIIQSIGWTLFHFLWQGLLVGLFFVILLALLSRKTANVRYLVACLGLFCLAACPIVTFWVMPSIDGETVASTTLTPVESALGETPAPSLSLEASPKVPAANPVFSIPDPYYAANPAEVLDSGNDNALESATHSGGLDWIGRVQQYLKPALTWMVAVWLMGVVFLSMRMLVSWSRVQRIKATGESLTDDRVTALFNKLSNRLGLVGRSRLLQSSAVAVPAVIGWMRPVVLMPVSVLTGLSAEQLSAVMAHELAHIRRADYLVNLFQSFIETVLFYHPCVWWLSARIRAERENCCDDLAAGVCGSPRDYAEALLKLEQLKPSPALAMSAQGASLVDRIARLLGKSKARSGRPLWLAGLSSLMIALFTLAIVMTDHSAEANTTESNPGETVAEGPEDGAGTEQEEEQQRTITVLVLDEEGNPLEGAHIHAGIWSKDRSFPPNQPGDTDEDGRVTINLPDEYYILRLWASADGYTRLFANWEEQELKSGDVPPEEYTFKMIKGVEIGGVIQNEKGEPIVGAGIGISASGTHPDGARRPRYGSWYAEASGSDGDTRVVTDEQGRWSLGTLPPADDLSVTVKVYHEDYIDDAKGDMATAQGVTTEQLLDKTATIVMQQGVPVTGMLADSKGKPVTEGLVAWGDRPYWERGVNEVRINVDGTYELPPFPPGEKRITVIAPGFRPETRKVDIHAMMSEQDFELVSGRLITIRIVDGKTEEPIPGAFIGIENWRSAQSIYNHQHPNVIDSRIPFRANDAGIYQWSWAPDDEVMYQVSAIGYAPRFRVPLTASNETHVVKLYKPLEVSGRVIDKATGDDIENFSVIPLRYSDPVNRPERFSERNGNTEPGRNGRFRITTELEGSYRFKIVAEGYQPFLTDMYAVGDDVPRLKLALEKAAWRYGEIVDSTGSPVSGADVKLASNTKVLQLREYRPNDPNSSAGKTTDENGKFAFPQSTEPYTLVILDAKGYAEIVRQPDEEIGQITLQPWASVEGVVYDDAGQPAPNVRVAFEGNRFQYDHVYHIQDITVVLTDNQGRYRFEKLPPIVGILRPLTHMTDAVRNEHVVPVDLSRAANHEINFGEQGVEVTGTFSLVGRPLTDLDYSPTQSIVMPVAAPEFGLPKMLQDADWRNGWQEVKRVTQTNLYWPGRTYLNSFRHYKVKPHADGQFTVKIHEPGTYDIGVGMKVRAEQLGTGVFAHEIGEGSIRFTIDQAALKAGKLDLGQIEVQSFTGLAVGDEVPDFAFRSADDQPMHLSKQRGHYLLLDFWAPWCEVCDEDREKLQQLAQELQDDASAARIISIENPGSGNYTRAPAATSEVWTACRMNYDLTTVSKEYKDIFEKLGVSSLPCYLIVDPEGKLVYHGTIGGAIEKMLEVK